MRFTSQPDGYFEKRRSHDLVEDDNPNGEGGQFSPPGAKLNANLLGQAHTDTRLRDKCESEHRIVGATLPDGRCPDRATDKNRNEAHCKKDQHDSPCLSQNIQLEFDAHQREEQQEHAG